MKNKIKTETTCLSHHCNKCGRDLDARTFTSEKLFMVGIMIVFIFLMWLVNWSFEKRANEPDCFTREYFSGRGTDFEKVRTIDFDCPNP